MVPKRFDLARLPRRRENSRVLLFFFFYFLFRREPRDRARKLIAQLANFRDGEFTYILIPFDTRTFAYIYRRSVRGIQLRPSKRFFKRDARTCARGAFVEYPPLPGKSICYIVCSVTRSTINPSRLARLLRGERPSFGYAKCRENKKTHDVRRYF